MSKITYVRTQRDKKVAFLLFLFSAILIALIIWGGNVFSKFEQYVDISSKNTIAAKQEHWIWVIQRALCLMLAVSLSNIVPGETEKKY